jgi:hypothetical protein
MVVRNTKTMRSTFEKREETQSISLGTPINDPEPSINEKMRTKSDLDAHHHLQLHFSTAPFLYPVTVILRKGWITFECPEILFTIRSRRI